MNKYRCAWFINFNGIGNGIIIAPILRCFEKSFPTTDYFHSENEILSDKWFIEKARLKKIKGFSPIAWRRFKSEDWDKIIDFINLNQIDLIVNLRNEGPKYDIGYYEFRKFMEQNHDLPFWDLDFDIIGNREKQGNLTNDILKMFEIHGVDISHYEAHWLAVSVDDKKNIGFGIAASQKNKRWPTYKWVELAQKIIADHHDVKIILFHGLSQEETELAIELQKSISADKSELINRQTLNNIAIMLGDLKCFISNDTGLLHICAAIGTPTIGLYISTDPDIWSPYNKAYFSSCVNTVMKKCPARKIHCGNCFHYYNSCPTITQYVDDIKPKQVFDIVEKIIT